MLQIVVTRQEGDVRHTWWFSVTVYKAINVTLTDWFEDVIEQGTQGTQTLFNRKCWQTSAGKCQTTPYACVPVPVDVRQEAFNEAVKRIVVSY